MPYDAMAGIPRSDVGGSPVRVQFALLADYASVTTEGKLDITGLFNAIYADSLPAVHLQMRLVLEYVIEPGDPGTRKQVVARFLDPDGIELFRVEVEEPLPAHAQIGPTRAQVLELTDVRFTKYGDHHFSISIDGQERATIPLRVTQPPARQGR